ncbi:hypothetical protein TrispH2_012120 [Trichoplax sp. H2]|nr:hypothetical protein TrispH2_012120 [Trichoplax sp. H2]|eukprot:RDD35868.1 hypothetical protein TrispH2_012120 [Trichoplax sp. H2]
MQNVDDIDRYRSSAGVDITTLRNLISFSH